jgi:hypothetical protein
LIMAVAKTLDYTTTSSHQNLSNSSS